ncbi:MAG: UBA/ThiF-type binding protein [Rhodoglobus sp.]|nr:UBA/ThiF-type binding protein [Rhodoglobus sp.]
MGMLAVEWLSRLGVGELVVVDPDRVEPTNLTRLPGARSLDAMSILTNADFPEWMRTLGRKLSTHKVNVAKRIARQAGQGTKVSAHAVDARDQGAAEALASCDYIVLAADSAVARHLANIISHQYLIPMIQVGVKVPVDDAGKVGSVFAVWRPVTPDSGCLRCAELIDRSKLAVEADPNEQQRRAADYGTGQPAPSVISLNAIAVSHAITRVLFALTGLNEDLGPSHVRVYPRQQVQRAVSPRKDPACPVCGDRGLIALGDLVPLPLPRP